MADLHKLLGEMHQEVIEQVLDDLRNGDRKARAEAMQLLKQNSITASLSESDTAALRGKMAGKLDFSRIPGMDKVIPIRQPRPDGESHPHTNDGEAMV
jgi:hypothetical protein